MRKTKLFVISVLSFIMLACVTLAACGKPKITLKDWTETTTLSVDLGVTYRIPSTALTVKDTKDVSYKVTVEVKTKSGVAVNIVANQFVVEELEGYVLTFTAKISDSYNMVRTVTLTVVDKGKPTIIITDPPMGYVGKEYVLPKIKITDKSGETVTPEIKVVKVDGATETPQTLTANKFTPSLRGEYKIKVKATDKSGNFQNAEKPFFVRNAKADNAFEDFNDPLSVVSSANKAAGNTTVDPTWLEEYDGRTGVVTADSGNNKDTWQVFNLKIPMTAEEILATDFDYISFWIWYDLAGTRLIHCRNFAMREITGKTWQYVTLSREQIENEDTYFKADKGADETAMEFFARAMTQEGGTPLFCLGFAEENRNKTVYIDDFLFRKNYEPKLTSPTAYQLGQEVTLAATVDKLTDYTITYEVTDPDGTAVTLNDGNKFTANVIGEYSVKAKIVHASEIGESVTKISVTFDSVLEVPAYVGTPKIGDTITIPVAKIITSGVETAGNITAKIEYYGNSVTNTDGTFVAENGGEYKITYSAKVDEAQLKEVITINVDYGTRPTAAADEVEFFDHPTSVANAVAHSGSKNGTVTFMPYYNGEYGVMKFEHKDSIWPAFTPIPRQEMAAYADYDYIVVRMFMVDNPGKFMHIKLGSETTCDSFTVDGEHSIAAGEWKDYIFPIAPFNKVFKQNMTVDEMKKARFWSQSAVAGAEYYVSSVKVIKDANFSISVTGTSVVGSEQTVNVTNTNNVDYKLTVTAPDGASVTATDNKFVASQVGDYKINVSFRGNVYGNTTKTLKIYSSIEAEVPAYVGAPNIGDEITVPTAKLMNKTTNTEITGVTPTIKVTCYEKDISIVGGKFTAANGGTYTVTYTFSHDGATYTATTDIVVARAAAANNEIESFDDIGVLDSVDMRSSTSKSYVDDKPEGATHGSVKFMIDQSKENWPILYAPARLGSTSYKSFNAIEMKIYITSTTNTTVEINFWLAVANEKKVVKTNEWVTLTLDIDCFRDYGYAHLTTTDKGWFWVTNEGGTTFQAITINSIMAVNLEATDTALVTFNTAASVDKIKTVSTPTKTFVDAAAIAKDPTLPALDGEDTGYVSIYNAKSEKWFSFNIAKECNYPSFREADYLEFKLYIKAGSTALTSIPLNYYETKIADVPTGSWQKVKMPMSIFYHTVQCANLFKSPRELFEKFGNEENKMFMTVSPSDYTLNIASVKFGKDTIDTTLGNKYTTIDTANFKVNTGTVKAVTFEETPCVKIESTSTWANIFIKPLKTYKELEAYTHVRLRVYVDAKASVTLYSQIKLKPNNTKWPDNDFFEYIQADKDSWHNIDVPIKRIRETYYGGITGTNAFMITRGTPFNALYISSMTCITK